MCQDLWSEKPEMYMNCTVINVLMDLPGTDVNIHKAFVIFRFLLDFLQSLRLQIQLHFPINHRRFTPSDYAQLK